MEIGGWVGEGDDIYGGGWGEGRNIRSPNSGEIFVTWTCEPRGKIMPGGRMEG